MKSLVETARSERKSLLIEPLVKKGLIAFIMAGDPDHATALRMALALIDEGIIALEIGVPFSDPVADGTLIQAAASRALAKGTTLQSTLQLIAQIKNLRPLAPIVLFTYLNPILKLGLETFVEQALHSGVDATLVVDLPPEESIEHVQIHRALGLGTVFLAAPNTRPDRLKTIILKSTGFVYAISRAGTTGTHHALASSLGAQLNELKSVRDAIVHAGGHRLPIAVGFGISTPTQAAEVAELCDAVIIGSRFVSLIHASASADEAEQSVRLFARECIQAIEGASSR